MKALLRPDIPLTTVDASRDTEANIVHNMP